MPYPSERYVALIDLDAFFASVEVVEHPELKGKPLLIGGSPTGRGVVAAASYEARRFGAHSAMPMAQALRLCPHATVLPARHHLYHDYSQRVMVLLGTATPLVQQVSVDEAYLELTQAVSDLIGAETAVRALQARVRTEVGLPCSAGLAQNKLVAKVACETGKPNGLVVVAAGTEADFLAGLPVQRLPGIGPRTTERLNNEGFMTLGQIASAPVNRLTALMGPWGAVLQRRAQGQDQSPVHTEREAKSISSETTFPSDIDQLQPLAGYLEHMATEVAESVGRHELVARTVTLKLRFADFTTITRSMSRASATANADAVLETARQLLKANWAPGRAVRLIGLGLSNLRPRQTPGQLALQVALDPSTIPLPPSWPGRG